MGTALYGVALLVIAFSCVLAVLNRHFDDNLAQRTGLAMTCLGACVRFMEIFAKIPDNANVRYLFTFGIAIYCAGTAYKLWRKHEPVNRKPQQI
jgi:hypothetical protein